MGRSEDDGFLLHAIWDRVKIQIGGNAVDRKALKENAGHGTEKIVYIKL